MCYEKVSTKTKHVSTNGDKQDVQKIKAKGDQIYPLSP